MESTKDKVFMRSPSDGEIREVEATLENLTPLMAAGWHQFHPPTVEVISTEGERTEVPGVLDATEEGK